MNAKFLAAGFALFLAAAAALPGADAVPGPDGAGGAFAAPTVRMFDSAGVLSAKEAADLGELLYGMTEVYGFDFVVVTEKDIGDWSLADYAAEFFVRGGFGRGEGRDGCIFLHVTERREYWFGHSGKGKEIINAAAWDKLEHDAEKFLGAGDYAAAYRVLIRDMAQFLALDAKGKRYNYFRLWFPALIAVAWVLSFPLAFIIVRRWKGGMDSLPNRDKAGSYVVPGSLVFRKIQDLVLNKSLSKIRKYSPEGGPAGSFGGSSGGASGSLSGRGGKY